MDITMLIRQSSLPILLLTVSFNTWAVETERVNRSLGTEAAQESDFPAISYNGSRVVFESNQPNLVSDDSNNTGDIFLFERRSKTISRISISSDGAQATGPSFEPDISGNGRYVVYYSNAQDLTANDNNEAFDVFRHDLDTGTTQMVSVNPTGDAGNSFSYNPDLSANGNIVVFHSRATDLVANDTNGEFDIFIRNMDSGTTERILGFNGAQPNGSSFEPTISEDGRFVAFESLATNLVNVPVGDELNVYLYDSVTNVVELVSVAVDGVTDNRSNGPVISRQGRYVAFDSQATNLVEGDTNFSNDVFRFDRFTKDVILVYINFQGGIAQSGAGAPTLSDNGLVVSFVSASPDILEAPSSFTSLIYQKDVQDNRVRLVSH